MTLQQQSRKVWLSSPWTYPAIGCRAHAHYNHLPTRLVHAHAFLTQKGIMMTVAATHLDLVVYATDSDMHCQH